MAAAPGRILVTGANGFVGRHLMVALASAFPNAAILAPTFDVADAAAVTDAVREAAPEVCIHLAAISTSALARPNEDRAWAVNLHGTLHLARAILRHAPECRLVFASTGRCPWGIVSEPARS